MRIRKQSIKKRMMTKGLNGYILLVFALAFCACGYLSTKTVWAAGITEKESNDSFETANEFSMGDVISGGIAEVSEGTDLDIYRFVLDKEGCVNLQVKSYLPWFSIYIYNSAGDELWKSEGNDYNENAGYIDKDFAIDLTQGTFYLKISEYKYYNHYTTGNYILTSSFIDAGSNISEPNNSFEEAGEFTVGSTLKGQIAVNDDYDIYKFIIQEEGMLSFQIKSYLPWFSVYIYDLAGNELWKSEGNDYNENAGYIEKTFDVDLMKGTYYVKVNGYKYYNHYTTGNYTITTSFVDANSNTEEPNNSFDTASQITLNNKYLGQIALNDEYDNYKIIVSKNTKLVISVKSYLPYYSVYVYSASGDELWKSEGNDYNENVGYVQNVHNVDLQSGTYFIRFNGYKYYEHYSTGNYEFVVSDSLNQEIINGNTNTTNGGTDTTNGNTNNTTTPTITQPTTNIETEIDTDTQTDTDTSTQTSTEIAVTYTPDYTPDYTPTDTSTYTPTYTPTYTTTTLQSQYISLGKATYTFYASDLKKSKQTFYIYASASGRISYNVSKGSRYISVNKYGKVKVKRRTPKGTYKVVVTAGKTSYYKKAKRTVKIRVI